MIIPSWQGDKQTEDRKGPKEERGLTLRLFPDSKLTLLKRIYIYFIYPQILSNTWKLVD